MKISDPDMLVPNEPSIAFHSCIGLKAKTLIVGEIEGNVMKNCSLLIYFALYFLITCVHICIYCNKNVNIPIIQMSDFL